MAVISPDGQTVAFIGSAYHAEKGSDGNFHLGQSNPSLYTVPISGGMPRRVHTRLEAGGAELSWKSNGTIVYDTEIIDLETGRQIPFVRPGPAYFFDASARRGPRWGCSMWATTTSMTRATEVRAPVVRRAASTWRASPSA